MWESIFTSLRKFQRFDTLKLVVPDYAVPSLQGTDAEIENSIIILSYVLQLTANPGIEMEIPLIITSLGYKNRAFAMNQNLLVMQQQQNQQLQQQKERWQEQQEYLWDLTYYSRHNNYLTVLE